MLIPELVLISTGMRLYHLTSEWGWEGSLLMLCLLPTEKWVEGDGKAAVNSISSWNLLWQHKVIWLWGDTAIALASASQFSELRVHGLIPLTCQHPAFESGQCHIQNCCSSRNPIWQNKAKVATAKWLWTYLLCPIREWWGNSHWLWGNVWNHDHVCTCVSVRAYFLLWINVDFWLRKYLSIWGYELFLKNTNIFLCFSELTQNLIMLPLLPRLLFIVFHLKLMKHDGIIVLTLQFRKQGQRVKPLVCDVSKQGWSWH